MFSVILLLLFLVSLAHADTEIDSRGPAGGVGDGGMTSGTIPKYDGSDLVDSVVLDTGSVLLLTPSNAVNIRRSTAQPNTGAISFGNSANHLFGATATGAGSLGFYWFDRNADSATSIGGMYDATAFTTAAATVFEWRASSVTVASLTTGGSFKTQGLVGPGDINLRTTELTVVDGDILGTITFDAPSETGADALLVTAKIHAEAAATFDATTNSTDLVFSVATDGAVVEQFRVKSTAAIHWAPRSAPPARAAAGDTYYDSDTNEFCVYNGSAWKGLIDDLVCA